MDANRTHPARVLYLQFANPGAYPPIAHSAQILAESGLEVRVIGTRPKASPSIEFPVHRQIRVTLIDEGRGFGQKLAFVRFFCASLLAALRFRPDWVYVSDAFAAPAGLAAAALVGAAVIYHEHDVHFDPAPSTFVRLCLVARGRLARNARQVVVPSSGRADHLRTSLGIDRIAVVANCPRKSDLVPYSGSTDGPLKLVYQGTIVPERLPMAVAEAVAELKGAVTLTLVGWEPPGAAGYASALVRRGDRGAPGAITHAGTVTSRRAMMAMLSRYDVGLALVPMESSDVNMRTMAGASNKAFDYLACGLALVVSDLEDWDRLFVSAGFAKAVQSNDLESVVAVFRWLASNRASVVEIGLSGQRRVRDEWNYEQQFAQVRDQLALVPATAPEDFLESVG